MWKSIVRYALLMAITVAIYKYLEVQYFSKSLSREIVISLIAFLFCGIGIWVGLKFKTGSKSRYASLSDDQRRKELSISERESEILLLLAEGHSNKEIAEKLFISIHTVKTHSSNLYSKLNARRRTEAIRNARELGLLTDHT